MATRLPGMGVAHGDTLRETRGKAKPASKLGCFKWVSYSRMKRDLGSG